jgi:hypothetical protein
VRRSAAAADDDLQVGRSGWNRERVRAFLERRYSTRMHMSLILAASGLAAMLASASMLHLGVHAMLIRYPLAITLAYVTFLVGVWVWLRVNGLVDNSGRGRSSLDAGNALDALPGGSGSSGSGGSVSGGGPSGIRGGGGSFDGGGASSSFAAESRAPLVAASSPRSSSSSGSSSSSKGGPGSLFDGLDGDGLVLLILAALLVVVVFAASGYLIWAAPDVLSEAAFGAMLSGTLARPTARQSATGWVAGVVRKTWWPFALVMAVATLFAGYAAAHYPQAATFKQALAMALL